MLADQDIYTDAIELPELDLTQISPGVRELVAALRAAGLFTCDSGDGSNHAAGMEFALPFPHVFIGCPIGSELEVVAAVRRVLEQNPELVDWPFTIDPVEVAEIPDDLPNVGAVVIWHADRSEICERVGYAWGEDVIIE